MAIRRLDHVGVVVADLAAAKAFFLDLGLESEGEEELEGEWLDQVVGLRNVRSALVMLRTSDGQSALELATFLRPTDERGIQPSSANTLGLRHIAFAVDDLEAVVSKLRHKGFDTFGEIQTYEDRYKLCYVRGPEGIILELAEELR